MNLNLSIILVLLTASFSVASAAPDGESMIGDLVKIHAIQGNGLSSPLEGEAVSIEAIVSGDFQGPDKLGGFLSRKKTAMLIAISRPQRASLSMILGGSERRRRYPEVI